HHATAEPAARRAGTRGGRSPGGPGPGGADDAASTGGAGAAGIDAARDERIDRRRELAADAGLARERGGDRRAAANSVARTTRPADPNGDSARRLSGHAVVSGDRAPARHRGHGVAACVRRRPGARGRRRRQAIGRAPGSRPRRRGCRAAVAVRTGAPRRRHRCDVGRAAGRVSSALTAAERGSMIASMRRLLSAPAIVIALGGLALAQAPKSSTPPKPISMDELHRTGGVPRGWKFTLPAGGDHHHHEANAPQEQTAGPYTVRVEYQEPGAAKSPGHLMVFVADAATGEPVPYLPVTAVIRSVETAPRTLRLSPMIGDSGFHYGADVTLPADTIKLTLTLGVATLKTMGPAARRFAKPVTLSFDWE